MNILKRLCRGTLIGIVNTFLKGTHFFAVKRYLLVMAGIKVGKNTKIVAPFNVGKVSNVIIGDDCWIGKDFSVHGNGQLSIGNNCDFGPEVSILTGSHIIGTHLRRAGEGVDSCIVIGNGCWLGARCTVSGDVTIEDGAIVAACALVNKDVCMDSLVGGIPAKEIRKLD